MIPDLPVYGFRPDLGGVLGLALTVVLPILAGLLTKASWSGTVKGVVLLALAAIKTVLEAWLQATNTNVDFEAIPVIYTTVINFGIAVAVYFGLYKNSALISKAQDSFVK